MSERTPWTQGRRWVEQRLKRWQVQAEHRGPGSSFCIAQINEWSDNAEADAHLLAAAPDLFKALKELVTHRPSRPEFRSDPKGDRQYLDAMASWDAAEAALAKARGETP